MSTINLHDILTTPEFSKSNLKVNGIRVFIINAKSIVGIEGDVCIF